MNNREINYTHDKKALLSKLNVIDISKFIPIARLNQIESKSKIYALVLSIILSILFVPPTNFVPLHANIIVLIECAISGVFLYFIFYLLLKEVLTQRGIDRAGALFIGINDAKRYIKILESPNGFLWQLLEAFNFEPYFIAESVIKKVTSQSKNGKIVDIYSYFLILIQIREELLHEQPQNIIVV